MAPQSELNEPGPSEVSDAGYCYRCGAALLAGDRNCPQCGRRQTRLCYCGQEISVTASACPHCGADWSTAFRVRRKTKTREFNWKFTAAYAAIGALAAMTLAALINSIVGGLAVRSLPEAAAGLPAGFLARLGLALSTVGHAFTSLTWRIEHIGGGPTAALLLVLAGAAIGAGVYLYRAGALRIRWALPGLGARKRRRRAGDH